MQSQTTPETSPAVSNLIEQALINAEYPIELSSTGKAQLEDGVFEEQAAPGSASLIRVSLSESVAVGDLSGDGSGPRLDYDIYGIFHPGQAAPVLSLSQDGEWWEIRIPVTYSPDGIGWVPADYVVLYNTENQPIPQPLE